MSKKKKIVEEKRNMIQKRQQLKKLPKVKAVRQKNAMTGQIKKKVMKKSNNGIQNKKLPKIVLKKGLKTSEKKKIMKIKKNAIQNLQKKQEKLKVKTAIKKDLKTGEMKKKTVKIKKNGTQKLQQQKKLPKTVLKKDLKTSVGKNKSVKKNIVGIRKLQQNKKLPKVKTVLQKGFNTNEMKEKSPKKKSNMIQKKFPKIKIVKLKGLGKPKSATKTKIRKVKTQSNNVQTKKYDNSSSPKQLLKAGSKSKKLSLVKLNCSAKTKAVKLIAQSKNLQRRKQNCLSSPKQLSQAKLKNKKLKNLAKLKCLAKTKAEKLMAQSKNLQRRKQNNLSFSKQLSQAHIKVKSPNSGQLHSDFSPSKKLIGTKNRCKLNKSARLHEEGKCIKPVANKIKTKKERKKTNNAEMCSKNENYLLPNLKFLDIKIILQKDFFIDSMVSSTGDFITEEYEECQKEHDLTNVLPKRKRTFSEPSKSEVISSDLESSETENLKNKKIKSSVRLKNSTKTGKPEVQCKSLQKRKRNLSAPSNKIVEEELSAKGNKSPTSQSKKRKKCFSLSEDSALNELQKTENDKGSLSGNIEIIDLTCTSSNSIAKRKNKKICKRLFQNPAQNELRYSENNEDYLLAEGIDPETAFPQSNITTKQKNRKNSKKLFENSAANELRNSENKEDSLPENVEAFELVSPVSAIKTKPKNKKNSKKVFENSAANELHNIENQNDSLPEGIDPDIALPQSNITTKQKNKKISKKLFENSAANELHNTESKKDSLPENVEAFELASSVSSIKTKTKIKEIHNGFLKDSTANELHKTGNKKESLPKTVETLELAPSPNVISKPKIKKIRKNNLHTAINDNEPDLFSQPDVLVKVKTNDVKKKGDKSIIKDTKIASDVGNSDNVSQITNREPESNITIINIDELSFQPENVQIPLIETDNFSAEYICEKDIIKENSVNSLEMDDSFCKNLELENVEIPDKEPSEINSNISTEKSTKNENEHLKSDDNVKNLISDVLKDIISNIEDLDSDKLITELNPNCTLMEKEFSEVIISVENSTPAISSCIETVSVENSNENKSELEIEKKTAKTVSESTSDIIDIDVEPSAEDKKETSEKTEATVSESINAVMSIDVQLSAEDKKEKSEVKNIREKQLSSSNSSNSTTSAPGDEKTANQIAVIKKSFKKNSLSSSKVTAVTSSTRKGLKQPIRKKQTCVSCHAVVQSINSCYCNNKCLEKHASDCLAAMKEGKDALKGPDFDSQKIVVLNRVKGSVIAGDNAPTAGNIVSWLKTNPCYMIALSSSSASSSKTASKKKETNNISKERTETSTGANANIRSNVRKTLKKTLMDRASGDADIQMKAEDISKIADQVETELNILFKDNSSKYKAKYRSLMFNIKDPRNKGLFRKILEGSIPPGKLVRMSPEELGSVEFAKGQENENQPSLDIIKDGELEQQSANALLLKKTPKGELEISDDSNMVDEIPKTTLKPFPSEPPDEPKPEPEKGKEIIKDTTSEHRSHLFDLNCRICIGKELPPPIEDNMPKKVHVAHSIAVDQSSSVTVDPIEKSVAQILGEMSPLSSADDSLDQEPTSTVIGSPPDRRVTSSSNLISQAVTQVWRGAIFMHEVTKFNAYAYNVSGDATFGQDLSEVLDICGRIAPDEVWDYLGKIKKSGNKELVVIRFSNVEYSGSAYDFFYQHLSTRNRYGVIKVDKKISYIKDFYILPLAASSPVPVVLLPFDGPGLPTPRTNLLIGIIVRHKLDALAPERMQVNPPVFQREKSTERIEKSYNPPVETRSYTPPLPPIQAENNSAVTFSRSSVSSSESSIQLSAGKFYSSSMPAISTEKSGITNIAYTTPHEYSSKHYEPSHNSYMPSGQSNSDAYEPSLTPPLHLLTESPNKPYDPEQYILNISADSNNRDSCSNENDNLKKETMLLNALRKELEETDKKVNELKRINSEVTASEYESPNIQSLDINSIAASGMSSFLPENVKCSLPESLQGLLNSVKEKPFSKGKAANNSDSVMRIRNSYESSSHNSVYHAAAETAKLTDVHGKSSSNSNATPVLDKGCEKSRGSVNLSDPRIKIRTSFLESFSEEPARVSFSNMSVSQLVERAEIIRKELAVMDNIEKVQSVSPLQERLAAESDSMPPTYIQDKSNRTSVQEPLSENPARVSLSTMSATELIERAEKELAEMENVQKVQSVPPIEARPTTTEIASLPPLHSDRENSHSSVNLSDPRIKLRTNFKQSFFEVPASVPVSSMSLPKPVQSAEKESPVMGGVQKVQSVSPVQDRRTTAQLSDPRIKIRINFQKAFSEEPANASLSNIPPSEPVERAAIDHAEKVQNVSSVPESLAAAESGSLPSSSWTEFTEPPPPGTDLSELMPGSAHSDSLQPDSSLPLLPPPDVQGVQQFPPPFPPPPLLPPPDLNHLPPPPPPNIPPTYFPPPPLPPPTDISPPVNDGWPSWNIAPQQTEDNTWRNESPQWDESWENGAESESVDSAESSSHYYSPGASEFHRRPFYRRESSSDSRWNRHPRFGRNNWYRRSPRGGHWRGRRGSFY